MTSPDFNELRIDTIRREFGGFKALKGVSLTIKRGEFIALLGPSGCGKTTALNCIAGLLSLSGGRIMLDDRRIDDLRPEERGFGMVFQNYALFPHMSVAKNIGFGLRMRGIAKAEVDRRVAEAVSLVRLQGQEAKLPGQLSGGQQQRVAIARAIVIEPPLVLMDEPLSNLDAKLRLEMRQEIRRIHASLGSTTIYVTHDQEEALSLADRIVVLREGEIRQVGTPEDLYARPADIGVADFMGYRNRLAGKIVSRDGAMARIDIGGGELIGLLQGSFSGDAAVVALRPEDLSTNKSGESEAGSFAAKVTAIEYRGSEFHGLAMTDQGTELHFSSHHRHAVGESIRLSGMPERTLVFEGASR
jgi:putative spermidine/putrescine transport system ATP-binding protein